MITIDEAREIARAALNEGLELHDEPIATRNYGWVFGYQSVAFTRTGQLGDMLAGNAPFLVTTDGRLLELGTALGVEHYLDAYIRFGDPHAVAGSRLAILGSFRKDRNAIAAIREIQVVSGFGLARAKALVDEGIAGKRPEIECHSAEAAAELAALLESNGIRAEQLPA